MKTHRILIPLLALLALLSSACVSTDEDSTLTIDNQSSFVLIEIRVAEERDAVYSENLLRGQDLFPGEEITVFLDCGVYDVLVVDEDGFECELLGLDLCFEDAVWVITDDELDFCGF